MNFLPDTVKKNCDFLEELENSCNVLEKECEDYLKEIDNFLNTGSIEYFLSSKNEKENVETTILSTNTRRGRQRKPALADITELNIPITSIEIKKEKISDVNIPESLSEVNIAVKIEAEEMPAPTKLPPRKKKIKSELELPKRSTRSRTRNKNTDNNVSKESTSSKKSSDVIIQNTTITTIELSDDTESDAEKNAEVRTTRSKMNKKKQYNGEPQSNTEVKDVRESERSTRTKRKKRARSNSVEPNVATDSKKSKSDSNDEKECNGSVQTDYEDAVSTVEANQEKGADVNINATFVTSNCQTNQADLPSVNCTVIVDNPIMVKKGENDVEQAQQESPELVRKGKGATKQIFSPFENTPMKKKVEAFEKLGASASCIPTRTTRTKKKLQKRDSEGKEENMDDDRAADKEKHRGMLTPIMSKFQPKGCSTSKVNKLLPHHGGDTSSYNESVLSTKSASALKASQAEFREREKRRQEKEREALKKREALLQAQTEEKRRKREEKQQKAQQQREVLEKEKLKQLEAQRAKDEKFKQIMAEREGKLQKQKEEAERKRQLAKKKAELQREEETRRAAADKQLEAAKMAALKQKQQQQLPVYMMTRPPLLPTDDCYDSDDPEYAPRKRPEPAWSREPEVSLQQRALIICGESIKNTFFCRQATTPDLTEIFEHIDPRKLKRTSSAIWRKPPRYTLMPTFDDQPTIFSEESD